MTGDCFSMAGRVAIVTGGTKGMGAASAERFAEHGAKVLITSRDNAELANKAAELNERFGNGEEIAIFRSGDLADKAHLQAMVQLALDRFGKITTLLCSPAIRPWIGSSILTPDAVIDEQLLYVFKSRFWLSSMVIPHMIAAGGGSLIYIGSGSPFEATSERSVNTIARAAEVQMMKNFASEFGRHNVRANIIAPGSVSSSGSQELMNHPKGIERIARLPLRRAGKTSEISAAALFLASDASSFTTGAVLPVDGGRLLHAVDDLLTGPYGQENPEVGAQ
jgi:NAD(P)-dependent dehydrogenase (short-subunit alcohol dehydrogenase family)